jgi:hypothetical protein
MGLRVPRGGLDGIRDGLTFRARKYGSRLGSDILISDYGKEDVR